MKNNLRLKNKTLIKVLEKDLRKLKSPEGFLYASDAHFKALFGRDSLITSWQMLGIDNSIAKKTLRILAKYQGKKLNLKKEEEPGKILHEYRKNKKDILKTTLSKKTKNAVFKYWDYPYYGSIDSTSLFIIILAFYYKETKDKALLEQLFLNLENALSWITERMKKNKDGFVAYKMMNPHGLIHQGWKDAVADSLHIKPPISLVEAQGYTYKAFREAYWFYKNLFKDNKKASFYDQQSKEIKNKFNDKFWMPDKKFYGLAIDKKYKLIKSVTSNVGHCLFTDIIDSSREKEVVKRLFKKDMFTDYGIRTLSSLDKNFDENGYHWGAIWPHDNWIIYQGLKSKGYKKEASLIKKAIKKAYQEFHYMPECYAVTRLNKIRSLKRADVIQAWSICTMINLIEKKG